MDVNEIIKKCEHELVELDALEPSVARTRARMSVLRLMRQLCVDKELVEKVRSLERRFERKSVGKYSYLEPGVQDATK